MDVNDNRERSIMSNDDFEEGFDPDQCAQMLYNDLCQRIQWHQQENIVTPVEVLGVLDLIRFEIMNNIAMGDIAFEFQIPEDLDEDEDDPEENKNG
jgi:hypothetical protein